MADPQVQHVLRHFAYPVGQPLDVLLRNLKRRIAMSKDFPHEIGLFLSYPPEDVKGFIDNNAANFKYSGLWKVYGDEKRAKAMFEKFKKCTDIYCRMWQAGVSLDRLAVSA